LKKNKRKQKKIKENKRNKIKIIYNIYKNIILKKQKLYKYIIFIFFIENKFIKDAFI
jgi:hypothetical protein